jgi:hypothetical protein
VSWESHRNLFLQWGRGDRLVDRSDGMMVFRSRGDYLDEPENVCGGIRSPAMRDAA